MSPVIKSALRILGTVVGLLGLVVVAAIGFYQYQKYAKWQHVLASQEAYQQQEESAAPPVAVAAVAPAPVPALAPAPAPAPKPAGFDISTASALVQQDFGRHKCTYRLYGMCVMMTISKDRVTFDSEKPDLVPGFNIESFSVAEESRAKVFTYRLNRGAVLRIFEYYDKTLRSTATLVIDGVERFDQVVGMWK